MMTEPGRLARALRHSRDGLVFAWRSEAAFRLETAALVASIPLALLASADNGRRVSLVCAVLAVMVVELLNTAIEKICDHVTPERNEAIRAVKDMGSAAVLCACLVAALFWLVTVAETLART